MQYAAVLITCFNRVDTTLKCLKYLFEAELPEKLMLDIYLVDDASPDKTGEIVKQNYPQVNIIYGTGKLYWCGGMRLAWSTAVSRKDYDYYVWLNDDTYIMPDGLLVLFSDYNNIKISTKNPFAVSGACRDNVSGELTYSGKYDLNELMNIEPSGKPQKGRFLNGNLLLIPRDVYKLIGNLSEKIIHRFGDYEYTGRLGKLGGECWVSSRYCAECKSDSFKYFDSKVPFLKRIKALHSPIGLGLKDDLYFRRNHNNKAWGKWGFSMLKKYIATTFPNLYIWIKRNFFTKRNR